MAGSTARKKLRPRLRRFDQRSSTGVVGVSAFNHKRRRSNGKVDIQAGYRASWVDPETGKQRGATFSFKEHGKKGAFRKACEARAKAEKKIFKGRRFSKKRDRRGH